MNPIGGVLKGATTSLDGVHDGLGAVLDTAAATMTRVPVAGDVAGGGVNAARHVLSAAFGAVRGVVSGAFLGCRAYVRGVIVDRDPLRAMGASSALFASGLADARAGSGRRARAGVGGRAARRRSRGPPGRRGFRLFEECRAARRECGAGQRSNGPDDGEADFSSSDSDDTPRVDPDALEGGSRGTRGAPTAPHQFCLTVCGPLTFGAFAALLGPPGRRRSRLSSAASSKTCLGPRATGVRPTSLQPQPLR